MSIFLTFFDISWQGVERIDRSRRMRPRRVAQAPLSFHRQHGLLLEMNASD
jgi:hypothetical protein